MNRVDFGRLLASLRKEHEGEDGNPWSQAVLARQLNLVLGAEVFTEDIVGKIERGIRGLDQEELLALAAALELTSGERKEFFLAASGINNDRIARQDDDPKEILSQLVNRMEQVRQPAYVMDSYCDIVAINRALIDLMDLEHFGLPADGVEGHPFPLNKVLFVFSDEGEKHLGELMGEELSDHAYETMIMFRTVSLRYRSTEYFQSLLKELRRSRRFRRYWHDVSFEEKDHYVENRQTYLRSRKWGPVAYFSTYLTALTAAGELFLGVYVPTSDETAKVFAQIADQYSAPRVFREGSWPGKDLVTQSRLRSTF